MASSTCFLNTLTYLSLTAELCEKGEDPACLFEWLGKNSNDTLATCAFLQQNQGQQAYQAE